MAREQKTCWQRGIGQPLGMAIGSSINLAGGIASLILSSQSQTINPLPFICTAMLTSAMYVGSNTYRAYQICTEIPGQINSELSPENSPLHADRIQKERDKITLTIER